MAAVVSVTVADTGIAAMDRELHTVKPAALIGALAQPHVPRQLRQRKVLVRTRIKLTKTRVQPLSTRSRLLTAVGSLSVIPIFDAPPGEPSSAKKSALIWA